MAYMYMYLPHSYHNWYESKFHGMPAPNRGG
jgi:hypothetical protein